ncbi:hypothetical protein NQT62_07695 [Limnobacter humi]|uniref:Tat pathway signal sequence domain protein n=1 Tax=Limnobacter humi TaxID=1778671 RepID=A0ABT1WH00_9BURK|nr:hypothetical protein [Limnobacter humi]MCQ8896316.1 hypothetical protein [Limnobacter humi]
MNRREWMAGTAGVLAGVGLMGPTVVWADEGSKTQQFIGKAYDKDSGQWIYTEQHNQTFRNGKWVSGVIRYVLPTGELIAEKKLDFSADPFIPLTAMSIPRSKYAEAITEVNKDFVVMQTTENGKTESDKVNRKNPMCADSGFHAFIQANLPDLNAGKKITLAFGVVGRRSEYSFRILKTGSSQLDGKTRVELRAEPDSLLRFVVDPLTLVYELESRNLLEYNGLSNIPDVKTGKPPMVKIVYSGY